MSTLVDWFYSGLGGTGGRWLPAAAAIIAVVWLLLDSRRRHLPAVRWGWIAGASAPLVIPSISIPAFTSQGAIAAGAVILSLLGTLGAVGAAVSYAVRFRGLTGCVKGHPPYPARLRGCPACARMTVPGVPGSAIADLPGVESESTPTTTVVSSERRRRPKVEAWLLAHNGKTHQLFQGNTTLGRDPQNDIRLSDMTVSRLHAVIKMEGRQFVLYDLGSAGGTWLNGNKVRRPEALDEGDEVLLGGGVR